ncbi:hypothetical protein HPO96_34185 [Kribbella sandramycini]|uniref:Uncharacterized protein n=1 Tax=Kribbella sandramycini TaxID=60450 RepID=A0A7Y4L6I0_9ACTN|nr:hypothetical protein [Kribbella sandramycini]MBB6570450.1 hypothetical protein [Kribbella sandramycini]NOL45310.1 hypothetical protein [Kribbella sandramycini]
MADEEFRVEVVLGTEEHGLTFWDRLRALDLDDDARKRLGSQVTVTRDGNRMLLYTQSLEDAQEAERTVKELVADDNLTAEYTVTRWNPAEQEWTDPSVPVGVHDPAGDAAKNADMEVPDPRYVLIQAYKPEFIRDLGL